MTKKKAPPKAAPKKTPAAAKKAPVAVKQLKTPAPKPPSKVTKQSTKLAVTKAKKAPAVTKAKKAPAVTKVKKAPAVTKAKNSPAVTKAKKQPAKAAAGKKTKAAAPVATNTSKAPAPAAATSKKKKTTSPQSPRQPKAGARARVTGGPPGSPARDTDARPVVPCFIAGQYTPYSCAVCSRPAAECTPCTSCKAVSYCSPEHERADRAEHRDVCAFIARKVARGPTLTMADGPMALANRLMAEFTGRLTPRARDALMRMPRCLGCGAFPAPVVCEGCGLVGRCEACARTQKGTQHHPAALCDALATSARAMRIVMVEERALVLYQPERPREPHHDPAKVLDKVVRGFANSTAASKQFGVDSWHAYAAATGWTVKPFGLMSELDGVLDHGMLALMRDQHCVPLSVFAGIMMAPKATREAIRSSIRRADGTLVIHVVGAEFEAAVFPVWEVLLHLFAAWGVSQVAVGFIGPQVLPHGVTDCRRSTVDSNLICKGCDDAGCRATAFYYQGTYEAFCQDQSVRHEFAGRRRRADVTIAPNAGLTAFEHTPASDPWPAGLKALVTKNRAPLNIVTAYEPDEAKRDATIFATWAAGEGFDGPASGVAVSAVQPNPFRSPLFVADALTITGWYAPSHTMWWFTVDGEAVAADDDGDGDCTA